MTIGYYPRPTTTRAQAHLVLSEGAGPRHLDFHPNGKWVYVLCELDGNVVLCDWDDAAGTLSPRQSIYCLPKVRPDCHVFCSAAPPAAARHPNFQADLQRIR